MATDGGPRTLLRGRGYAGYPSVCHGCGNPVTLDGGEPLWFETIGDVARSWHARCRLSVKEES